VLYNRSQIVVVTLLEETIEAAGEIEAFALIDQHQRDIICRLALFAHPLRLHEPKQHEGDAQRTQDRRAAAAPNINANRYERDDAKRNDSAKRQRRIEAKARRADHRDCSPRRSSSVCTCT